MLTWRNRRAFCLWPEFWCVLISFETTQKVFRGDKAVDGVEAFLDCCLSSPAWWGHGLRSPRALLEELWV